MMPDQRRRLELRDFLLAARSRLTPAEVGLPDPARPRRIAGLSQGEVGELLGTSTEWYRWFESGREMRVSERFLEGLAEVLRLSPLDRVMLYRLALPGLYDAHSRLSGVARGSTLTVPIGPETNIERAVRTFDAARAAFLGGEVSEPPLPRPRVLRSWQRSWVLGVDAGRQTAISAVRSDAEMQGRREMSERLLRAARPVLTSFADSLTDSGFAIVLTDAEGCVLDFYGGSEIRRHMEKRGLEPGFDWSEATAGTNAIGIALADRRPFQMMAGEHFCEGWTGYGCTAAPIRDPATNELAGALDLTGVYGTTRPELLGLVVQAACEIEESLHELT
jgi:transcriptional regulator with XRE-family HTH domain